MQAIGRWVGQSGHLGLGTRIPGLELSRLSQAEWNFPGFPRWAQPMSKQLDFDECLRQNATFQAFLGVLGKSPSSWILMKVSSSMQLSRLSLLDWANVQTAGF